jgi:hypothetical protein
MNILSLPTKPGESTRMEFRAPLADDLFLEM